MNAPIADAAARAQALDTARSFIVEAPAGSGKTELLSQRVLALLATVDHPEEVVAITFTRKAAAEMRHRIFSAIRRALDEQTPAAGHSQLTWSLARAALARSRDCGWSLEQAPQRLRITTIDALSGSIVQQSPLVSGLGGPADIEDQADEMYREAARNTLALIDGGGELAAVVARVLQHFDNQAGLLEQQLISLLARRDQWLSLTTADAHPREAQEALLLELVHHELEQLQAALPAAQAQRWLWLGCYAQDNLRATDANHPLAAAVIPDAPAFDSEQLAVWQALSGMLLTNGDTWRKSVDVRSGFPAGKGEAQTTKDELRALIGELSQIPGLDTQLARIRRLPSPRYPDAQWEVLQALLKTMQLAAAQLMLVFATRGAVDFTEIAQRAEAALGDEEGPSDLALRLDYRIRHLLVDEFQDTSSLQLALLQRLTAGWQAGDGRTLFVVGDPKQSVYRFRQAEVGLYLQAQNDGIGSVPLERLQLSCNFRSRTELIAWFNRSFPLILPASDPLRGAVAYAPATAPPGCANGGAVQVHAAVNQSPEQEAQLVVNLIRETLAADGTSDVALLVRGRSHLAAIAPALRAAAIAYQAVDIEPLAERPLIDDLRALTRALLHPGDRIAWLALLRAPWCGLPLKDLQILSARNGSGQLLDSLVDASLRAQLSADGARRLGEFLAVIEPALADQGRKPLRRWIEDTWVALDGPAWVAGTADLTDAQTYFAQLDRFGPDADAAVFARLDAALGQLKAAPASGASARVQIMTIHRSKGLQFDTVIVPGLGRAPRSPDKPPLAWTRLPLAERAAFLLGPVHAVGDEPDRLFDLIREVEADKQSHEDGRLLYVAATRAERQLHLIGELRAPSENTPNPLPAKRSLLEQLWPAVTTDFRQASDQGADLPEASIQETVIATPAPLLLRRAANWQRPPRPVGLKMQAQTVQTSETSTVEFDWAGHTARLAGTVAHFWLQQIAETGLEHWTPERIHKLAPAIGQTLTGEGLSGAEHQQAGERVQQALINSLDDERGRWILGSQQDARCELRLSEHHGDAVRDCVIDRSFVDESGTRWLIDYKTGAHEGGDREDFLDREQQRYQPQLEHYARLFAQLENRPIRLGLYFPMLKAWRSWAPNL
jgi:ATP-dependent exoDNAse (exonuclease V) beta subunit